MDPVNNRPLSPSTEWDPVNAEGAGATPVESPPKAALECRAVDDPLATPNPAVRSLVDGYDNSAQGPAARASASASASAPAPAPADNNACRTMQRDSSAPYVESEKTLNGDWFAGAASLKTRDPRTGVDAEVFTASAQVGKQNEVQAGLARVGYSGDRGDGLSFSVAVEAVTARANLGIRNDDGSEGGNLGAVATGVGVESTLGYSGWSVTAGASISMGATVSSGDRDVDGDGVPERCFKASIGPATLGFCSEL
jgi:hypothetical protein